MPVNILQRHQEEIENVSVKFTYKGIEAMQLTNNAVCLAEIHSTFKI